ncbi:hypothetical protein [Ectobacillus panaciterrae]|uniref:hypothetical protein n=1 Tax=Ectobacillus panaciterrae TaxID=363872 RepID=UPI0003F4E091|nr:hypothetical protein [Ectobacillus panaciterrae]
MKRILIFCILLAAGCQNETQPDVKRTTGNGEQTQCIQALCKSAETQKVSTKRYFVRIASKADQTALKTRMEETGAEVNQAGPWLWHIIATPSTAEEISHMPGVQYIEEDRLVQAQ